MLINKELNRTQKRKKESIEMAQTIKAFENVYDVQCGIYYYNKNSSIETDATTFK